MSPSIIDYSGSSSQDYTDSCMYGPDNNTEANISMVLEEAEKLYNKLVKDCTNKTIKDLPNKIISEVASNGESLSLSLPRKELSDIQKDSTQRLAANMYGKEEEHTFIQSEEIDDHDDHEGYQQTGKWFQEN